MRFLALLLFLVLYTPLVGLLVVEGMEIGGDVETYITG